jgi:hypothetical protein
MATREIVALAGFETGEVDRRLPSSDREADQDDLLRPSMRARSVELHLANLNVIRRRFEECTSNG